MVVPDTVSGTERGTFQARLSSVRWAWVSSLQEEAHPEQGTRWTLQGCIPAVNAAQAPWGLSESLPQADLRSQLKATVLLLGVTQWFEWDC